MRRATGQGRPRTATHHRPAPSEGWRDAGAALRLHNAGQVGGDHMKRWRARGPGPRAAPRRRGEGHGAQPFFRSLAPQGRRRRRQNTRGSEDKGPVPAVREPIFEHGEGEREVAGVTMILPAMAAPQTFRRSPMRGRVPQINAKSAKGPPIGGDGRLAGARGRGGWRDPDMAGARRTHGGKIQPIQGWITQRIGMGEEGFAIPVDADPA